MLAVGRRIPSPPWWPDPAAAVRLPPLEAAPADEAEVEEDVEMEKKPRTTEPSVSPWSWNNLYFIYIIIFLIILLKFYLI